MDRPLPFRVLHVAELMAEGLEHGTPKFRKVGGTVTFPDPCQLVRHVGAAEAPRKVLEALGLTIKEPWPTRELNWCCGGSGVVVHIKRAEPLRLKAFAIKREQLDATGAERLATTCASCREQFDDAGAKTRWDRFVESLVVLATQNLIEE